MARGSPERSHAQRKAEQALTAALQRMVPHADIDRGRVGKLEHNLLPGVHVSQFKSDVRSGAGNELRDKFLAPYSSSALAVNSFARFKGCESQIRIDRRTGFDCLRFERPFPTGLGGTAPHLDVVLSGHGGTLAIESKCTEHMATKRALFSDSYDRLVRSNRQSKAWLDEMNAIRLGRRNYAHLDAAQLIKHAFGLAHSGDARSASLLYLHWEPLNSALVPELSAHRRELRAFAEHVAGGSLRFHAMSYRELWGQWAGLDEPSWLREHVARLRGRYEIAI